MLRSSGLTTTVLPPRQNKWGVHVLRWVNCGNEEISLFSRKPAFFFFLDIYSHGCLLLPVSNIA